MAEARYDQDVRRDKDLLPYVYAALPEREFGDVQFDGELVFGNGEDGDVTISADTSLSEDMYYSNLTIDSGKTLNPNGWRVFVKNTLTLNGDLGIKESVTSVSAGSLSGAVAAGANVVDGLGGSGEPDNYVSGYTFAGTGAVTSSVGVSASDFYDLRAAVNAYKQRGSDYLRGKGGAGGGTGVAGVSAAGTTGSYPPNANTVGAPGGKGVTGTGGAGGGGGRGGAVVMLAARVINGAGGIYSEGGASTAGSAGTPGSTAPAYHAAATTNHHEGPDHEAHTPAHDTSISGVEAHDAGIPPHEAHQPGHASHLPGNPDHDATNPDHDAHDAGNPPHDSTGPGFEAHDGGIAPHEAHTPGAESHDAGIAPHEAHTPGAEHHDPGSEQHNPAYEVQNPTGFNPGGEVHIHHFVPAGPPGVFEQVFADHTNPPVPSFHEQHFPVHDSHQAAADATGPAHDAHDAGNPVHDATGPPHDAHDAGNPAHDQFTPGTESHDAGIPPHEAHAEGIDIHAEGIPPHDSVGPAHDAHDAGVAAHDQFTPGHEAHIAAADQTAEGPNASSHTAAVTYSGGAGGTGYTGQRGGRGGGGVLIVVTRDAGVPGYSFNTGINGTLIALDTANI